MSKDIEVPSASFKCHHCGNTMPVAGSYWHNNELYLYGTCPHCEEDVPFKVDELYAFFLGKVLSKGNNRVN